MSVWSYADIRESIAAALPDEPAFIQGEARLDWRDFDAGANGLAATLLAAGLGHQAKVAVYTQNCAEYLTAYFAAFKAGMVPLNVNYRYGPEEIAYLLDNADAEHPFRLATSPARSFLNSTFPETPSSVKKEVGPTLMLHPDDASRLGIMAGDEVIVGNSRGSVHLAAVLFEGVVRGVVIAESIWPNAAHKHGRGINTITGADGPAPFGGAAFHDNKVWIKKA